jgi:hypothetical protein
MFLLNRSSLKDRIPPDVLERAEAAGVKNPVWYTGRLYEDDRVADNDFDVTPAETRREGEALLEKDREHRREHRAETLSRAVARLHGGWRAVARLSPVKRRSVV